MIKAIVTMSNWKIDDSRYRYNLSGTADHHPKLGKNTYVGYTSTLIACSLDDDVLIYETRNTIYRCPLKYMNTDSYKNVMQEYVEKLLLEKEGSDYCLDKIIATEVKLSIGQVDDDFTKHVFELTADGHAELEEKRKADDERMLEIIKQYEDSIYLEVSCVESGDKLAYNVDGCLGILSPCIHVGMFQDSILYMKHKNGNAEDDCAFDFRYFPKGLNTMETYSWSDNIKCVIVKNVYEDDFITFNGCEIATGETKVFTSVGSD